MHQATVQCAHESSRREVFYKSNIMHIVVIHKVLGK